MPGRVFLIGAVRGLESEGGRVSAAIARIRPGVVALSLSREGMEALGKLEGATADQAAANPEEEAYIRGLSAFGEVVKPPPCFSGAWASARGAGIALEPLDMDDEHYTAAYCKHVGTLDMMRQGRSGKLFERYEFVAGSPEEFVIEWDALVNRLKGYRALERSRELWMAKGVARLAGSHGSVAAVIELERLEGVREALEAAGMKPEVEPGASASE